MICMASAYLSKHLTGLRLSSSPAFWRLRALQSSLASMEPALRKRKRQPDAAIAAASERVTRAGARRLTKDVVGDPPVKVLSWAVGKPDFLSTSIGAV